MRAPDVVDAMGFVPVPVVGIVVFPARLTAVASVRSLRIPGNDSAAVFITASVARTPVTNHDGFQWRMPRFGSTMLVQ
ncbi:MAG: hypothetical protein ACFCD0_16835 [Gemmataceae bacterium]